jgi:hypothetical protein
LDRGFFTGLGAGVEVTVGAGVLVEITVGVTEIINIVGVG